MPTKKVNNADSPTMAELNTAMSILDDIIGQVNKFNKEKMEYYGVSEDFTEFLCTLSEDDINELTLSQVNSYLSQYGVDADNIMQVFSKQDNSVATLDKWKEFFKELKTAAMDSYEMVDTRAELQDAINNVYRKQADFLQSDEYRSSYNKKIDKIKQLAELEQDPTIRKRYLKKLDALRQSSSLSFLLERLDDPKINKKDPNAEIKRLVDGFFSFSRGNYTLERYHNVIKKLNVTPQFHQNLYNIEEDFLPEYFHPLNNFFLYVVMSYIAYVDVDDDIQKLYAITILSMIGNLRMNMIGDNEKETLLNVIRNIENRVTALDDIVEKFKSDNTTWKEHPLRQELDAKKEEMEKRGSLITEIQAILMEHKKGFTLSDGTEVTPKNIKVMLSKMDTVQIEGILEDVKKAVETWKEEFEKEFNSEEVEIIEKEDEIDDSETEYAGGFDEEDNEDGLDECCGDDLDDDQEQFIDECYGEDVETAEMDEGVDECCGESIVEDAEEEIAECEGNYEEDENYIEECFGDCCNDDLEEDPHKKKIEIPVEYTNPPLPDRKEG